MTTNSDERLPANLLFLNSGRHLEIIVDTDCRGQMEVVGFRECTLSLGILEKIQ